MRSRGGLACLTVALALSGCGGANKTSTSTSSPEAPAASYTAHLVGSSGRPPPADKATGVAVIGLYPSREALCWTISQLNNVTTPRMIAIRGHVAGTGFLSAPLGRYAPVGCRPNTPARFFELLESHTHNFEFIITAPRPGGPLSGKL